jgi:plastocyanin
MPVGLVDCAVGSSLLSQARWLIFCLAVASLLPAVVDAKDPARVHEVRMQMSKDGTRAYFDPIGIHIQPGDTIRWVQISGYHSATAYHPANGNHELRIPEDARPWDSDVLVAEFPAKGSSFEHVFHHEGVYDYFCKPHEAFNYSPKGKWSPIPPAAQTQFPSIEEIMMKSVIHPFPGEHSK